MTESADRLIQDGCLVLYGIVGQRIEGWNDGPDGFTASDVVAALATLGRNADVTVRINSGGGIATEGAAIHAVLSGHGGRVTTVVEGLAASAASIIAMAGADRIIARGSLMMIHDPSGLTVGTADDHDDTASVLRTLAASMASIYADATGRPEAQIRAEMRAETWLTAEDAVLKGYADQVGTTAVPATAAAPFPFRSYAHAPAPLVAMADARGWSRTSFTAAQMAGRIPASSGRQPSRAAPPQADTRERAITEMCALAGQPDRAAAFIASGADRLAVLADLRASQGGAERTSQSHGNYAKREESTSMRNQSGGVELAIASMRRELARAGLAEAVSLDEGPTATARPKVETTARRGGTPVDSLASMRRELARSGRTSA